MSNDEIVVVGDTIVDRVALPTPDTWRRRQTFDEQNEIWMGGVWNSVRAIEQLGIPTFVVTAFPPALAASAWEVFRNEKSTVVSLSDYHSPAERLWVTVNGDLVQINRSSSSQIPDLAIPETVVERIGPSTAILVQDYAQGVASVASRLPAMSDGALVWDGHSNGPSPLAGAILTGNNSYALYGPYVTADSDPGDTVQGLRAVVNSLGLRGAIATLGHRGAYGYGVSDGNFFAPGIPHGALKYVGAGDLFSGALVAALANEEDLREATRQATIAAARLIRSPGVRFRASGQPEVTPRLAAHVATGGCFDLLHAGHLALLSACRQLAHKVTVLMNSDRSTRTLKGPGRPLQSEDVRARQLYDTGLVDNVVTFDAPDPCSDLELIRPQLFVKGSDYVSTEIPEQRTLSEWGGTVITVPLIPGFSTSRIVSSMQGTIDLSGGRV